MVSFVAQLKSVIRPMFQNSSFVEHCVPAACDVMELVMVFYKASWAAAGVLMLPG